MKKILFICLGFLMFGLGTLGIFLPFLPTTVFYLLTAFFWIRSSERLHQKLIHSESYQHYVEGPIIKKQMTPKGRRKLLLFLLLVFGLPGMLVDNTPMRICLVIVYLGHVIGLTWYLKRKVPVKAGELND